MKRKGKGFSKPHPQAKNRDTKLVQVVPFALYRVKDGQPYSCNASARLIEASGRHPERLVASDGYCLLYPDMSLQELGTDNYDTMVSLLLAKGYFKR